ncbi:hypothetical protein BDD12DRAFT_47467 [Trichophaea hybrida]|nr:hypothetical protein BDD12DRAFT_47467 [Trichophaea hybrida]
MSRSAVQIRVGAFCFLLSSAEFQVAHRKCLTTPFTFVPCPCFPDPWKLSFLLTTSTASYQPLHRRWAAPPCARPIRPAYLPDWCILSSFPQLPAVNHPSSSLPNSWNIRNGLSNKLYIPYPNPFPLRVFYLWDFDVENLMMQQQYLYHVPSPWQNVHSRGLQLAAHNSR